MRVLKATGVETEVNVAFAGLDQVVRPVLPLADRLPSRQAEVLKGALGVIDQVSHDRFLLGAATLSLLSEAAEDGPVLCVIEDAHWLDQSSAETLAFAARRLEAEGIALIVATRDEPWPGLPTLPISGLKEDESDELLRQTAGMIAAHVAHQLFLATDGNPLALVELAASIPAEQLAGDKPLASRSCSFPAFANSRARHRPSFSSPQPTTARILAWCSGRHSCSAFIGTHSILRSNRALPGSSPTVGLRSDIHSCGPAFTRLPDSPSGWLFIEHSLGRSTATPTQHAGHGTWQSPRWRLMKPSPSRSNTRRTLRGNAAGTQSPPKPTSERSI